MTWFRKDDQWPHHPKVRMAGVHGRALWDAAGPLCAARNSDGVVEAIVIKDACYLAEVDESVAVAALIKSGLWHNATTIKRCERCKKATGGKLPPGACYFHDWLEYQLTRDVAKLPEERARWRRRKALSRNVELRERINERDRGLCRYCGVRVDFRDRISDTGGQHDHVDPDGDNSLANVVTACRGCNRRKHDRTPEEAGMTLLAPGTTAADLLVGTWPDSGPGQVRTKPDSGRDLVTRAHAREGGRARSDLAPARSEPDRLGDGSGRGRGGDEPDRPDGPETAHFPNSTEDASDATR